MRSALRNNLLLFCLIMWAAALAVQLPGILIMQEHDNEPNLFIQYAAYLPGASIDLIRTCETHELTASQPDFEYGTCYPESSDSPFRAITVQAKYGIVTRSVFYVREGSLRLPEMMLWFGPFSRILHSADRNNTTYVSWLNNIIVHINQWHGMMSYISFIDMRENTNGNS